MGGLGSVGLLILAGLTLLNTPVAWVYIGAVAVFEFWLRRRIGSVGDAPVPANEPPYLFTRDEAELVGRYRFYFTWPEIARQCGSMLAAVGVSALLLVPWLIYKLAFVEAILVGANLFVVSRFTRLLAPVLTLRIRAHKGDRVALRSLELHDPLWAKIRAANTGAAP